MAEPLPAAPDSRQIRVFLSSTFRDFMRERDLLVKQVFPALRRRAKERGVEVVDMDLRWGITEEESQQGRVIGICLAEIERCRPYFIGMLGGDMAGCRSRRTIRVIEADAAVQKAYPYRGKPPEQIGGGGGTDFNPAFRWLREESRQRFDRCIYLTDGYAEKPTIRPPCRLLWVVTEDGQTGDHLPWGKAIQIGG